MISRTFILRQILFWAIWVLPSVPLLAQPDFTTDNPRPMIDFAGVQSNLAGDPTRVLVLASNHLNQLPEEAFQPSHLSLVLDRLEAFAPDIIAIEAVSGFGCDALLRYKTVLPWSGRSYCIDRTPALEILDLTAPEAAAAVEKTFQNWPANPTPAERRRLAILLYGAGEPWSAALQWSKLAPSERILADGMTAALKERLDRFVVSRNENNLVGMVLARRLGLESIAAMDDHSADLIRVREPEETGTAVQKLWEIQTAWETEIDALEGTFLGSAEKLLQGYLHLNSEAYQRGVIESDFALAAASPDADAAARQYLAWWQARGLRMAANVVEASGNKPGAKILVIVGASHKAYFDAYLDQMHDVEIVDVSKILNRESR